MNCRKKVFALFFAASSCAAAIAGQDFWAAKSPDRWSHAECEKLLEDSPWAKRQDQVGRGFGESTTIPRSGPDAPIRYLARFRSALPIRQAMVRQSQLDSTGKKLSEAERKTLEIRHRKLLEESYADRVVIDVYFTAPHPHLAVALMDFWRHRTPEAWKNGTILYVGREKVAPIEVTVAPGKAGHFQLAFPRKEVERLLGSGEDQMTLQFFQPTIDGWPGQSFRFEFKVREMTANDRLAF